jgi:nickel/cobalt exporter
VTGWFGELDAGSLEGTFLGLVDRETGLLVILSALVIAVAVGAAHALGPGHGKVLMAAYLVGAQGRRRDAMAVGAIVALMHTGSVLALGLVLYLTQRMAMGEWLETVLTLVSACGVTVLGAVLLTRQLRARRERRLSGDLAGAQRTLDPRGHDDDTLGSHRHDHGHDDDRHHHGHSHHRPHQHGPGGHSHEPPAGVAPLSGAGLVALASSGGLLPSPSALLVLAAAMAIGRTGFGLALVVAFSVGLATTLTVIGLTCVLGRRAIERRVHSRRSLRRAIDVLPVAGAAVLLLGGLMLAGSAVAQM